MRLPSSDSPGPYFRYTTFFFSWIWLIFTFWFFAIPSILLIVFLNVPVDLEPKSESTFGIAIPGKLRILIEIMTITLGLLASVLFGSLIAIIQLLITIAYLRFDGPRLSWLWGWATYPPTYVTQMYSENTK